MAERRIDIVISIEGAKAGKAAKDLANTIVKGMKATGAAVKTADKKVEKFGDELKETGKKGEKGMKQIGAGAVAAGNLIDRTVRRSIQELRQLGSSIFENTKNFRAVSATVINLDGDFKKINAGLKQIDATYANNTSLMNTYFQIQSGGITNVNEGLSLLEDSAKLAFGEAANLQDVAATGIKVWNVYGEAFTTTAEALEQVSAIAKAGDTNLQRLAAALPTTLASARGFRIEFAELGAAVAVLTQRFRSTEQATMFLNGLFTVMSRKATPEAVAAIKDLGIEWSATALASKGLIGLVSELSVALERFEDDPGRVQEILQALTGSAEAKKALDGLIGSLDIMPGIMDDIANSSGRIDQVAGNMAEAIGPVNKLNNAWHNMQIEMGEDLAPAMLEVLTLLNDFLPLIKLLIQFLPTLTLVMLAAFGPKITKQIKNFTLAVRGAGIAMQAIIGLMIAQMAIDYATWFVEQTSRIESATRQNLNSTADILIKFNKDFDAFASGTDFPIQELEAFSSEITATAKAQKLLAKNMELTATQRAEARSNLILLAALNVRVKDAIISQTEAELRRKAGLEGTVEQLKALTKEELEVVKNFGTLAQRTELVIQTFDEARVAVLALGLDSVTTAELLNNVRTKELEAIKKLSEVQDKQIQQNKDMTTSFKNIALMIPIVINRFNEFFGVLAKEVERRQILASIGVGPTGPMPFFGVGPGGDRFPALFGKGQKGIATEVEGSFFDIGIGSSDAFVQGFQQNFNEFEDLGRAIAIGLGNAFSKTLKNIIDKMDISGPLKGIFSAFAPVVGNFLAQGISSIFSKLFGGGGGKSQSELLAEQRAIQLDQMIDEFLEGMRDVIDETRNWDDALDQLTRSLSTLSPETLDEAVMLVGRAIDILEDDISDFEDRLLAIPDEIREVNRSLSDLRFGLVGLRNEVISVKEATRAFLRGPSKFDEAGRLRQIGIGQLELQQLNRQLAEQRAILTDPKSTGIQIQDAQLNILRLEDQIINFTRALNELKKDPEVISFAGRTGAGGIQAAISRDIRRAIADGLITSKEARGILAKTDDPTLQELIRQRIIAEQAIADRKVQIQLAKDTKDLLQSEEEMIIKELPIMRRRLGELRTIDETLRKGFEDLVGGQKDLIDAIERIPSMHSGGFVSTGGLTNLDSNEFVMSSAMVDFMRRGGAFTMNQPDSEKVTPVAPARPESMMQRNEGTGRPTVVNSYHITIPAWDGESVDAWLNNGGAAKLVGRLEEAKATEIIPRSS